MEAAVSCWQREVARGALAARRGRSVPPCSSSAHSAPRKSPASTCHVSCHVLRAKSSKAQDAVLEYCVTLCNNAWRDVESESDTKGCSTSILTVRA